MRAQSERARERERETVPINSRYNAHTPSTYFFFLHIVQYLFSKHSDGKMVLFVWKHAHSNVCRPKMSTQTMQKEENGMCMKTASNTESVKGICFAVVHLPNGWKKAAIYTRNYVLEKKEFAVRAVHSVSIGRCTLSEIEGEKEQRYRWQMLEGNELV